VLRKDELAQNRCISIDSFYLVVASHLNLVVLFRADILFNELCVCFVGVGQVNVVHGFIRIAVQLMVEIIPSYLAIIIRESVFQTEKNELIT
jgi:hypothetical protein